jgi:hypothetical protein
MSPATLLWRPISQRAWRPRCASGAQSSSASSSTTSETTGCMPPGCCSPPPACAGGRWLGFVGSTSTWTPDASHLAALGWSSTTRSSSLSRRQPRADVRSPSTRPPWPLSVTTGAGSSRTGSRSARGGRTQVSCSLGRTVGRCTPSGSPSGSSSTPEPPGCRRSGCTTSATVTPPPPWPPGSGQDRQRAARTRQHRHHHGHL